MSRIKAFRYGHFFAFILLISIFSGCTARNPRTEEKLDNLYEVQVGDVLADLIKKYDRVLVDFYAMWCAPCRTTGKELHKLAKEQTDLFIIKVNVDNHKELMQKEAIKAIPTLRYYEKSDLVTEKNQGCSLAELKRLVGTRQ